MCTGVEIAALGAAALSVAGTVSGSKARKKEIKREAQLTRLQTDFELRKLARTREQIRGAQVAAASKGGVTQSGSILEVITQSAAEAELEAINLEFGGAQAIAARRSEARNITRSGAISAGSTLLSIGGSFA